MNFLSNEDTPLLAAGFFIVIADFYGVSLDYLVFGDNRPVSGYTPEALKINIPIIAGFTKTQS
jgi:hypothetical protein